MKPLAPRPTDVRLGEDPTPAIDRQLKPANGGSDRDVGPSTHSPGSVSDMSNVLDNPQQQQILAFGRLDWSLRRIEQTLAVRRETIGGYLKAAGIAVRGLGRRGKSKPKPEVSSEVCTDSRPANRHAHSSIVIALLFPDPFDERRDHSTCEPTIGRWIRAV